MTYIYIHTKPILRRGTKGGETGENPTLKPTLFPTLFGQKALKYIKNRIFPHLIEIRTPRLPILEILADLKNECFLSK